ncbi:MAG: carbohydrate ABC transporter permease [Chloroflexaceae bacterium]
MRVERSLPVPRRRWRIRWDELLLQGLLIGIGLIIALPIVVAVFTSFKPPESVITYPPRLFPGPEENWTLRNYVTAFNANPFGRFLLNSFIQSGIITIGQVFCSILAAYAFAVLKVPGRNILFPLLLGSLMIPFELTVIPNFQLVSGLGWANTYAGLTVPFLASAFGVFMLRQFFLAVPSELHDAARIDGASNWRYLWQVLVPLSAGPIGAFGIFAFLSAWNQYLWPLLITDAVEMRTIQIGIRFFMTNIERGADWGAVMAGAVIAIVPTLIAFLIAQKQLVESIAMTGMK